MIIEYDMLMERGLYDDPVKPAITSMIGDDWWKANEVLEYVIDDMKEDRKIEMSVAKLVDTVDSSLTELVDAVTEKVKTFELEAYLPDGMNLMDVLKMMARRCLKNRNCTNDDKIV